MKKNNKIFKGKGCFQIINFIIYFMTSVILISNTLSIVVAGFSGIMKMANDNLDSYIDVFYDEDAEGEKFTIVELEESDKQLFINGEVSNGEIIAIAWIQMVSMEILAFCIVNICHLVNKFLNDKSLKEPFAKKNLEIIKNIKLYMYIILISNIIFNIIMIIYPFELPFESTLIDDVINWLVIYGLIDFVHFLIKNGTVLKEKELKEI